MLHILFLILKIIGIILLVILGILVIALGTVLFVPARYQIEAQADGDVKHLTFRAGASWLLHAISAYAVYREQKWEWQVRIFWKKHSSADKKTEKIEQIEKTEESEQSEKSSKTTVSENTRRHTDNEATNQHTKKNTQNKNREKKAAKQTKKQTWFEKIQCTILRICDKIKELWEMKEKIQDFLTDEIHLAAFRKVKQESIILAKHLRPRKLRGYVRYGLEDPYHTGQVLAGLSVLYPFYGDNLEIYPEFEQKILEGDVYIKGHMRAVHFLRIIWYWYFDRDIKQTYRNFKKIKS